MAALKQQGLMTSRGRATLLAARMRSTSLDSGSPQTELAGAVEQGAGDESLADLGIGAGQEEGLAHLRA